MHLYKPSRNLVHVATACELRRLWLILLDMFRDAMHMLLIGKSPLPASEQAHEFSFCRHGLTCNRQHLAVTSLYSSCRSPVLRLCKARRSQAAWGDVIIFSGWVIVRSGTGKLSR